MVSIKIISMLVIGVLSSLIWTYVFKPKGSSNNPFSKQWWVKKEEFFKNDQTGHSIKLRLGEFFWLELILYLIINSLIQLL